jgi:hypothetical protein
MVMTTSVLYCDQTPSKEGSIVWIMVGMSWDVSAGPRTMPVVQNIKMIAVIPNKNLCSRERNKGPLELQERARKEHLNVRTGDGSIGNEKHARAQKHPD